MRLLVQALACDLTRVATLQWSTGGSPTVHAWASTSAAPITQTHHSYSHIGASSGHAQMISIGRWYAGQFANFLDYLKAVPEGAGTMLDNSIVLWCTEVSDGDTHSRSNMPLVLAGRGGGTLSPGRCIQYSKKSNNQLLAAIGNRMGLSLTGFGDPAFPGVLNLA